MSNLKIWEQSRSVPQEAKKPIAAGRLKGYTDINPMWRLKILTEMFGMCGVGWKYEITEKRLDHGANEEISAFVDINLFVKHDGEWSEAIPGTGGSSYVAKERNGLYVSDECFKMAMTDAISVACKALGIGADVYWEKDSSKYNKPQETAPQQQQNPTDETKEATVKAKFVTLFNMNADNKSKDIEAEYSKFIAAQQKKYSLFQINAYLAKQLSDKASK